MPTAPIARRPWNAVDLLRAVGWFVVSQLVLTALLGLAAVTQVAQNSGGFTGTSSQVEAVLTRMSRLAAHGPGEVCGLLFEWAVFLGMPWYISRKKATGSLRRDFGLSIRWRRDVLLGLGAAIGLNIAFELMSGLLTAFGVNLSGSSNTDLVTANHGIWLVLLVVCASLVAPVMEELFFRGFLLRTLLRTFSAPRTPAATAGGRHAQRAVRPMSTIVRAHPATWSAVLSGVVFGVLHFQGGGVGGLFLIVQTVSLGVTFGFIAERTKRLGPTVCGHIANNTASSLLALWTLHH